jgi:glycosyltransferase involved in cell wall biosynthesis
MSDRARILFLSQCLPYPPHSGVTARTFNILKQLRVDFAVTLLAFSRKSHQRDTRTRQESERALADLLDQVGTAVPIPAEESGVRRVWDHLRSLITSRPYTFYQYDSEHFRSQLRQALARARFDLVHMDSLDLHRWLGDLESLPIACTHHDIESRLLRLRAQWVGSRLLRRYLLHQAELVERIERTLCPNFSVNLTMSERDAERLRALAPGSQTTVVPNGVDTTYFAPQMHAPVTEGRVVFVGSTHTFPNRDAVAYLLSVLWPLIRRRHPHASLYLIGGGPDSARAQSGAMTGVTVVGRVPDVRPHLAQASCCIVPLRVGSGTRLKILDAWAMGKAVVSTSLGCEGLDAIDGENILVCDDPESFAAAVIEVLTSAALRSRLGDNGRATAEQSYSWEAVGRRLRAAYWKVLTRADALVSP